MELRQLRQFDVLAQEMHFTRAAERLCTCRMRWPRDGSAASALVSLPQPPMGIEHISLLPDRFAACLPATHRLASRDVIAAGELRDEAFVFMSRDRAPITYDQLMGFCAQAGFHPEVVCEPDHTLSAAKLVSRGLGISLLPMSLADAGTAGIVFVPVESPPPDRHRYFAWKAERRTPGLDIFIDSMRAYAGRADSSRIGGVVGPQADGITRRFGQ